MHACMHARAHTPTGERRGQKEDEIGHDPTPGELCLLQLPLVYNDLPHVAHLMICTHTSVCYLFRTQAGLYVEWDSGKAACKCKLMCTCACMPAPRTPGHSQESGLSLQSSLPRSVSIGGRGSSTASSNPSVCPAPQTLSVPLFLSVGCRVSSASNCSGYMHIRVDTDICRHTHRQTHAERHRHRHRHVHTQTQTHTYARTHIRNMHTCIHSTTF